MTNNTKLIQQDLSHRIVQIAPSLKAEDNKLDLYVALLAMLTSTKNNEETINNGLAQLENIDKMSEKNRQDIATLKLVQNPESSTDPIKVQEWQAANQSIQMANTALLQQSQQLAQNSKTDLAKVSANVQSLTNMINQTKGLLDTNKQTTDAINSMHQQ